MPVFMIEKLITIRNRAIDNHDLIMANICKFVLKNKGVSLIDGEHGTTWKRDQI